MSYFPKGHRFEGDTVDDFDEYDPTPYGGGYDIAVTFGRPLEPSEETCYPISSSGDIDYDRPQYSSYAEPSAYAEEALDNEYKSYARPNRRPGPPYGVPSQEGEGYGYEKPQPNYGFQPGMNRPGGGYGGESEYGGAGSGFGSGYGRTQEHERPSSEYGSGYQRPSSEYERPTSEYGSGYERPSSEFGSGYGRKNDYENPGSEYQSGYGRKSEYNEPSSEYGSGYDKKSGYDAPTSEYGSGYGRRTESEGYGSGYERKTSYGEESGGRYGYGGRSDKPSYETQESEGRGGSSYERPSYGRSEEEDYRKPSYGSRDDDDKGYGRKKYGDNNSDDEDEGKKHRNKHHHHHRKDYDDE